MKVKEAAALPQYLTADAGPTLLATVRQPPKKNCVSPQKNRLENEFVAGPVVASAGNCPTKSAKYLAVPEKPPIFVLPNGNSRLGKAREISSAGSEHLPYKQRVTGSNPVSPTLEISHLTELLGD